MEYDENDELEDEEYFDECEEEIVDELWQDEEDEWRQLEFNEIGEEDL